ncbi:MAG: hypothetical protein AAF236_16820 [Verrucomicrobiota bacterium]
MASAIKAAVEVMKAGFYDSVAILLAGISKIPGAAQLLGDMPEEFRVKADASRQSAADATADVGAALGSANDAFVDMQRQVAVDSALAFGGAMQDQTNKIFDVEADRLAIAERMKAITERMERNTQQALRDRAARNAEDRGAGAIGGAEAGAARAGFAGSIAGALSFIQGGSANPQVQRQTSLLEQIAKNTGVKPETPRGPLPPRVPGGVFA